MSKNNCKICGEIIFNKAKQARFCKKCGKAYELGYRAGYHVITERMKNEINE